MTTAIRTGLNVERLDERIVPTITRGFEDVDIFIQDSLLNGPVLVIEDETFQLSGEDIEIHASDFANIWELRGVERNIKVIGGQNSLLTSHSTETRTFDITGVRSGRLTPFLTFEGFKHLVGSSRSAGDRFVIHPGGSMAGGSVGGWGSANVTLDFSEWTTSVSVDLSAGNAGSPSANDPSVLTDAFKVFAIRTVVGGAAGDRITGGDLNDVLLGGGGNDTILGGNGHDVLVGGAGNDQIEGDPTSSTGFHDILIGGNGADSLLGAAGSDLLIAGWTDFDSSEADLRTLQDNWLRTDLSFQTRCDRLANGMLMNKVRGDWYSDFLRGGAGSDWVIADPDRLVVSSYTIGGVPSRTTSRIIKDNYQTDWYASFFGIAPDVPERLSRSI